MKRGWHSGRIGSLSGGRLEDPADDGGLLLSRGAVGRLGAILYLGSGAFVIASLPLPQPAGADRAALFALACAALAMGALSLIAPWDRWRRAASLWLVPPAFVLIAAANLDGGFPYFSYGVFFVVVFVWIGVSHRPAVTVLFAPLATIAYVVPVIALGRQVAAGLSSAASVIPVCILVGESLAWVAGRFAKSREELQESLESLRKVDAERRRLLQRWVSAAEEERQRIAADIHDDTIQIMSAAAMRLSVLETKPLSPRDREIFDGTTEAVLGAIERLRCLIFALGPEILALEGLGPAIEAYLAQDALTAPLQVHLANHVSEEPPDEIRLIAYRIAQEALNNVRKHAKATIVDVVLESKHDGLSVEIRDDGTGFSPTPTMESPPGHLGLTSMRERAQMAGGWLTITSGPGMGTTLEYWLPIRPPKPAAIRDRLRVAS